MKKKLFRFLLCMLALCLCFGLTACNTPVDDPNDETTNEETTEENSTVTDNITTDEKETEEEEPNEDMQSIDIYIIAGQSNAAGCTVYNKNILKELWPTYNIGTPNVIYTGRADTTAFANTPDVKPVIHEVKNWDVAKAGQGRDEGCIGPEAGMAKILAEKYYMYDEATGVDHVAGIIKYSHAGTSLLNKTSGDNGANGNWIPPSYAQQKGLAYSGLTGGLYRNLLTQVETSIEKLKVLGYNDINIKGMFWMQGEADKDDCTEYAQALKCLITDIRRDLGEIVGEDLSNMAFMIGEISETSATAYDSTVLMNKAFIEMQRQVAASMDENVYIISSGKYHINWLENGVNVNAGDAWHWSTADMFNIGVEVGECILENILKKNG